MPQTKDIADAKVLAATGKTKEDWYKLLDQAGAKGWKHKEIADWLYENHLKRGWWCQMVTVAYEQSRGLRKLHETTAGFQISSSKTLKVPVEVLYNHFEELENTEWTTKHEHKALRGKYHDTRLEVYFYPKNTKTQVVIQQTKLKNAEDAEHMKAHWRKHLEELNGE